MLITFVATVLVAQLCGATPASAAVSKAEVAQAATLAYQVDQALLILNECRAQSCYLADASGSSGKEPTLMPEGANEQDQKCVIKYNPEAAALLDQQNAPKVPKQDTGASTSLFKFLNALSRPSERVFGEQDTGKFTGRCTPNILIFAKGTLEPGDYGITVGLGITTGLGSSWSTVPVVYDATVSGDFCLGLPGGMVAKDIINQAAAKCPDSKLFVSGYSQGAMVARNGVAYADDSAKDKVKGVVTFGDPFNGSPIKGYNGPIKVFCGIEDGVCGGNFEISGAHLAYPSDKSVPEAKEILKQWAATA